MSNYTEKGLERLCQIIAYCQKSDRSFQNPKFGDLEGHRISIQENKKLDYKTLDFLSETLWIPFSERDDRVTGGWLSGIGFTVQELREVASGRANCRAYEDESQSPFTAELERIRGERQHSYEDMCEYCLLPKDFETVQRIRKMLLFSGWSSDIHQCTQDVLSLGKYLADLEGAEPKEQGNLIHKATKRLVNLQSQSVERQ